MRWCRAASCGTPPPSCSVTWPAGNRRRLPTDPVVLRGRLPLSLRATREPHKVEPRADRGTPGRAGSSGAALSLDPYRGHERQGFDLRVHGDRAARPGLQGGVYTSPHLVSVRERMEVDGVPIGEEAFAE